MPDPNAASLKDALAGKDPITAVNQFCQRYCERPITKEDIAYQLESYTGKFQATVTLGCLEGLQFAGEVLPTQKEAKTSAAQQVLDFYDEALRTMPAVASKMKKKAPTGTKRPLEGGVAAVPATKVARTDPLLSAALGEDVKPNLTASASGELLPSQSPKAELNAFFSKVVRRVIQKGEIVYTSGPVQGGFQATVQLPGLPGHWANQVWAGEVSAKKADAEQSVASVALNHIKEDPMLMDLFNKPAKPSTWKGGGKGGGKGKTRNVDPNPRPEPNSNSQALVSYLNQFTTNLGFS